MTEIELLLTFPIGGRVRRKPTVNQTGAYGTVTRVSSGYVICDFPGRNTQYHVYSELEPCPNDSTTPSITDPE